MRDLAGFSSLKYMREQVATQFRQPTHLSSCSFRYLITVVDLLFKSSSVKTPRRNGARIRRGLDPAPNWAQLSPCFQLLKRKRCEYETSIRGKMNFAIICTRSDRGGEPEDAKDPPLGSPPGSPCYRLRVARRYTVNLPMDSSISDMPVRVRVARSATSCAALLIS